MRFVHGIFASGTRDPGLPVGLKEQVNCSNSKPRYILREHEVGHFLIWRHNEGTYGDIHPSDLEGPIQGASALWPADYRLPWFLI